MVAVTNILTRNQVIAYVGENAGRFGVDPAAVLAVANHEGLNTAPGSKWWLPKESNWSFGPPSWYGNGAGATILHMFGGDSDKAAAFAWSPAGLDLWLSQVGTAASGLTGIDAIRAIVTKFERPAEQNVAGEITNASRDYPLFQQAVGGGVQVPTLPGQTQTPGQVQTPVQATPSVTAGLLPLGQIGAFKVGVPTGLLLGLLALVLLLIGAILMAGRDNAQQAATVALAA